MALSIRSKFLLTIILLLAASLSALLWLSVRLFREDKRAYLFEAQSALVSALSSQVEAEWSAKLQFFNFVGSLVYAKSGTWEEKSEQIAKLFERDPKLAYFSIHERNTAGSRLAKLLELRQAGLTKLYKESSGERPGERSGGRGQDLDKETLARLPHQKLMFFQPAKDSPLLGMRAFLPSSQNKEMGLIVTAFINPEEQVAAFGKARTYMPTLVHRSGKVLLSLDAQEQNRDLSSEPYFRRILESQVDLGVGEMHTKAHDEVIFAYRRVPLLDLVIVTKIPAKAAYLASQTLIEKSVIAAVIIIAFAMIIGIVFSRRLTDSLRKLYTATLSIAKGDFNVDIAVQSKDEVGTLSLSFKKMALEIVRLLALSAEKARMERELETAQLVQKNFFPKKDIKLSAGELAAFHRSASECGGDWWGYYNIGDMLYLCIGDATGHGVPAALITASVKSAFETITLGVRDYDAMPLSVGQVLERLNRIVFTSGGTDVKMSFFVASIDLMSGDIQYSNAAHNFPILCRAPVLAEVGAEEGAGGRVGERARKRERLHVLTKKPDNHLGDQIDSRYGVHREIIREGDFLLLYTDGLIECHNAANEMFGKKRLLKLLEDSAGHSAGELRQKISDAAFAFFGETPLADDVTFVVFKMLDAAA